jgi:hypothetical protein
MMDMEIVFGFVKCDCCLRLPRTNPKASSRAASDWDLNPEENVMVAIEMIKKKQWCI